MTTPTGNPDWAGPRLTSAEQIVISEIGRTLTAGTSDTWTAPVIRPSYLIKLHLQNITDTTTVMPVKIDMQWLDTSIGTVLDRQIFNIFAGDSTNIHFVFGKGPCAGNQLSITIQNNAATPATLQYELDVAEISQYQTYHNWHTDDFNLPKFPGYTLMQSDLNTGIVAQLDHFSLGAGATVAWALPLFNGPVTVNFDESAAALNGQSWILNGADPRFAASALLYSRTPAQLDQFPPPVYLPRNQTVFQLASFAGAAQTISVAIVADIDR